MKSFAYFVLSAGISCALQAVAGAPAPAQQGPGMAWDLGGAPGATQTASVQQLAQAPSATPSAMQADATNPTPPTPSSNTGKQAVIGTVNQIAQRLLGPRLPPTYFGQLTPGGLPQTRLDSFVKDASGSAEMIYGDEGTDGPPPYFQFTEEHRIERGINSGGLTTGHRSDLPEAWGWPN